MQGEYSPKEHPIFHTSTLSQHNLQNSQWVRHFLARWNICLQIPLCWGGILTRVLFSLHKIPSSNSTVKKCHFCCFLQYQCGFSSLFPLCLLHVPVNEMLQKCQNSSLRLSIFFFFGWKCWAKYNLCYQVILAFLEQLIKNTCPVLPRNRSHKLEKRQNNNINNSEILAVIYDEI